MPTTDIMNYIIKLGDKSLKIFELEALVEECVDGFDLRKAKELAKQLASVTQGLSLDVRPQVQGMIARLKILALPLYYDREDVLTPFRVGLGPALHHETPYVIQRLQAKFLDFDIVDRDQWRQDIVTTLHQNSDVVTSHGPAGTPNAVGTISTWLMDYDRAEGSGIIEDVKISGYLFRSKSTTMLSPDDRQALVRLIQLYEYLKLSSATSLGIEESLDFEKDGVIYDLNRGHPIPILDLRTATSDLTKLVTPAVTPIVHKTSSTVSPPSSPPPPKIEATSPLPPVPPAFKTPTVPPPLPQPAVGVGKADVHPAPPPKISPPPTLAPVSPLPPPPKLSTLPAAAPPKQPSVILPQLLAKELPAPSAKQISSLPQEFSKKPSTAPSAPSGIVVDKVEELTKKVMREISVPNLDPEQKTRLENVIRLRLREVRDTVDTRDALLKRRVEGGVELSDQMADEVITVIMKYLPEAHRPFSGVVAAIAESDGLTPPLPPQDLELEKAKQTIPKAFQSVMSKDTTLTPVASSGSPSAVKTVEADLKSAAPEPLPSPPPLVDSSKAPGIVPMSSEQKIFETPPPTPVGQTRKPAMIDVRSKPPVVGPIDELRLFTLADFRRLDADPRRATSRLHEKIKLLEEESYVKMVEGIRAWRLSPLNQLYLSIGHESLEAGKNVADAIRERREAGKVALTEEEFGALLDLNKQLRF
ncbi:hypothetical protein A3H10_01325 [Candidatus Uhrbacteria bacterium RIFCSPLOWO2_12_FULL_46_10]|uniref:Uncharacterized protein n=1 Tax=Candidatus Uhrbacteria bacterium RIFCSPLOWO2_01_FULL_47_25 TaxID=1802402 RepID=A0A1F7UZJ3_9BACT|nr:MAG: hypothetical protein UX68_C0002G0011 [Parcubacteria group bacterium GW2011_GWA2_46_9]OGL60116.1 MAG: hypothetical protein A2752_03870 [Candidatus Uhrbacteria bacterium RIFCSPHIGHO2_01_FULL_46_23]OGL83208.1 MAG: hypothetical protein A2936_04710 [Candidatus Uhrbacteria bacterium RIFCSPLOWO2_01_FULL_47_25]OGL86131.1 MAG: hypothetical protein A3I37_00195 [Candidatus Uhrbacteria bacterium RIFCSPLOWO2_02_FULL_46_19]OGL90843.1 MAG: hypothetical protein A3H10_01325 [Candidatus Uhrbacteria bacte